MSVSHPLLIVFISRSGSKSNTPEGTLDKTDLSDKQSAKHKTRTGNTPDSTLNSPSKDNLHSDVPKDLLQAQTGAGDKLLPLSTTNSPKLGVKMLGSHHIAKNGSNVAVVQPRPGEKMDKVEKMETTFDSEGRTETINKMAELDLNKHDQSKVETTFLTPEKEEKETFLDDAGETIDIKPMPPIMRALPYGYFRGYTGYGGMNQNRNFHIPGESQ